MLSILYLLWFLAWGVVMVRWLLPRLSPLLRVYLGLSLGVLLMMWLPALLACALAFTLTAHWAAAGLMGALAALCYLLRDPSSPAPFDREQKRRLRMLALLVAPMTLLSAYLQYTHSLRLTPEGAYHVGQSTYGDLSLHLAVATSVVNAPFPLSNSLMLGASMAYPYLADSFAGSFYMLGMPLNTAMAFSGTLMMALVYAGYTLLCLQLCRRAGAVPLAVCLLFFNGGLGFFYTLSGRAENGQVTTILDNLRNVLEGYYQTPTNQPDPNNLRWSNIICDMLIPQRGILGGWTMLLPCFNLLLPPLAGRGRHGVRGLALLGLFAGGMPLLHTHSFLALALASAGFLLHSLITTPRGSRLQALLPWLLYGGIAAALALPQLIPLTLPQAAGSDHFLRFQFNWCNNRGGRGLVDPYLWFYVKNIGLPFPLILLSLLPMPGRVPEAPARRDGESRPPTLLPAAGGFLIYGVAEFVLFQPNEYDNNKLFYVWFMLCLPMAAEYALSLYEKLRGLGGRRIIAGAFLFVCFVSAGLTVAREWVSDYRAYAGEDIEAAEFIKAETPEHSVFVTGNQHLNPVSSLAGRTILCSSDLYLYFHGFNTRARRAEIAAFYENPAANLAFLKEYGVQYIYVSAHERDDIQYDLDEAALEALFPLIYDSGGRRIFSVPDG
ncbi:MAG: hypothetical protein FWF86_00515 [Clostridia bacterium]|nr:hypothetical protein [Clostridia bacterium]